MWSVVVVAVSKELWITKPPLVKPPYGKDTVYILSTHCNTRDCAMSRMHQISVDHLPRPGLWVWTCVHFCPLCLRPICHPCQLSTLKTAPWTANKSGYSYVPFVHAKGHITRTMCTYRKWIKRMQFESLSWIWTCFRSTLCPRGRWVVSVAKDTFWSDENTGPAHGATSMWTKSEWKAHFLIAPQTLYSVHASVSMSPMIPGTVAWEFIVIIQNPESEIHPASCTSTG